MNTEEF